MYNVMWLRHVTWVVNAYLEPWDKYWRLLEYLCVQWISKVAREFIVYKWTKEDQEHKIANESKHQEHIITHHQTPKSLIHHRKEITVPQ